MKRFCPRAPEERQSRMRRRVHLRGRRRRAGAGRFKMGRLRPAGLAEIFHPDGGCCGSSLEDGLDGVSRSSLHPEALLARQAARRRDGGVRCRCRRSHTRRGRLRRILSIQPAQARSPRSPTRVERIMRVANQRAEENQRAARAAPSLLQAAGPSRWGSRPADDRGGVAGGIRRGRVRGGLAQKAIVARLLVSSFNRVVSILVRRAPPRRTRAGSKTRPLGDVLQPSKTPARVYCYCLSKLEL